VPKNSNLQTTSEHAFAAVLIAALDVGDLPFQCPLLHIFEDVDDLQAALRERVISPYRKGYAIHSILDEPLFFSSFRRADSTFWGYRGQLFSSEKRLV
jgi:hypothetical protein